MILKRLETGRSSLVAGQTGCFAAEAIARGEIIEIAEVNDSHIYSLSELDRLFDDEQHRYSFRLCGDYYYIDPAKRFNPTDYLNHSFEPNVLYFSLVTRALRDIEAGEELCVDYRYLLAEGFSFQDAASGREIRGLSAAEAAKHQIAALEGLL